MVNKAAAAMLAEPEATIEPTPDLVWSPPRQPSLLGFPVVAVALSHEYKWQGKSEHAAQILDVAEGDIVSLIITPVHHQAVRAMGVRHMSAIEPLDRWGWRHVGEEAGAEGSLTAAPDAEQP